jgi:hypothetical protein
MTLKTYALPSVLMLAQTFGLVLALVADGPWEWLATALIAAPVLIFSAFLLRRSRQNSPRKT